MAGSVARSWTRPGLVLRVAALLAAASACELAAAEPVSYARRQAAGVALHVIEADLNDPRVVVSPVLAAGGRGRSESFMHFVSRLKPIAAINGTFFSKRTLLPVGDIVANGKMVHFGGTGTAIAFAKDGVDVVRLPKSRRVDWSEHRAALAGGPLLVWDGYAKPVPGGEGFGDPRVFSRAAPRTAVGITRTNRLLLVTTVSGCSLRALATAMRRLGAVYAINLDGGSSCAMYYRGRVIRGARRALTNVFVVRLRPDAREGGASRAPQGLDWRRGHQPRPGVSFWAQGIRFWVRLPRRWEEDAQLYLRASRPLPEGWEVRLRVDQELAATVHELPATVSLELKELDRLREHEWRVNVLDRNGKVVGHTEAIFRMGESGRRAGGRRG